MKKNYLLLIVLILSKINAQTPPYSGTIFIDPDIITSSDPSVIQSTTYTGQGSRVVYDRRVNNWITINAYLFNVIWNDGLTSEAIVNPEFGNITTARIEAEKYAFLIGQLPYCLRVDVNQIWIHQGVQAFGGGNHSILIHTGQSVNYEASGILEETLVHEASHTSLDFAHSTAIGWTNAQSQDGNFISTYARDNPTREDIAESFLTWLMVRYRASKISITNYNSITQTIPNRLLYFDSKSFNLYPFFGSSLSIKEVIDSEPKLKIYPNPTKEYIQIPSIVIPLKYEIYDSSGLKILKGIYSKDEMIDIQNISNNLYFIKFEDGRTSKFIKN